MCTFHFVWKKKKMKSFDMGFLVHYVVTFLHPELMKLPTN